MHDHRQLLGFINESITFAGQIGKMVLREKDSLRLFQRLSELYLLAFLRMREGADAQPAVSGHDLDLKIDDRLARIEVYCPMEYYGFQFVKMYCNLVFRYSPCPRGFYVSVKFVTSETTGYHAHQVTNKDKVLRRWLTCLQQKVDAWLSNVTEGSMREFAGPNQRLPA